MKVLLIFICFIPYFGFTQSNTVPQHLNTKEKVGWIAFDPAIDRNDFVVCDELNIEEYYQVNPKYGEGIRSIENYFAPHLTSLNELIEHDGYITIRFVINCKGETDRYRCFFVDSNFESIQKNKRVEEKLRELLPEMGKWTPGEYNGKYYDAYQHIKFRVVNKKIVDVLF